MERVPDMTDSPSRPASKPLDLLFSKWTALLAVLLLIGGVALWFWVPHQRLRWAIQEIEAAGGKVEVDFKPVGPRWLWNFVGDKALRVFAEPRVVSIRGMPQIGTEGLKHLADSTNLEHLWLSAPQVIDEQLKLLADPTELRSLNLENTQLNDSGLKHLMQLRNLERLWLHNTVLSDEDLARLRRAIPRCKIQMYEML